MLCLPPPPPSPNNDVLTCYYIRPTSNFNFIILNLSTLYLYYIPLPTQPQPYLYILIYIYISIHICISLSMLTHHMSSYLNTVTPVVSSHCLLIVMLYIHLIYLYISVYTYLYITIDAHPPHVVLSHQYYSRCISPSSYSRGIIIHIFPLPTACIFTKHEHSSVSLLL